MINHFEVVCSVTLPLNGGEAVRDLVLILCCSYANWHLNKKREVCINARSPPASLVFIGQVTKHSSGLLTIRLCRLVVNAFFDATS